MKNLTDFQKRAAVTALDDMFNSKGFFSICDFDNLAKLLGVYPSGDDYRALKTLHCVSWSDMDNELRVMVKMKVLELLSQPNDPLFNEEIERVCLSAPAMLLN